MLLEELIVMAPQHLQIQVEEHLMLVVLHNLLLVVQETGQLWEVHEVYSVQNVYVAESIFWKNTKFADIPFMGGVEIIAMKPEEVRRAMDAVLELSNDAKKVDI